MTWTAKELDRLQSSIACTGGRDITAKDWSQLPGGRFGGPSLTVLAGRWSTDRQPTARQAAHLAKVLADFELTALVTVSKPWSVSAVMVLPEEVHPGLVFEDIFTRAKGGRLGGVWCDTGEEVEKWDILPRPVEKLARALLWAKLKELSYFPFRASDPGFLTDPHVDYDPLLEILKGPIWDEDPATIMHNGSYADPSKWVLTPELGAAMDERRARRGGTRHT